MATYAIGDLQGMFQPLLELVEQCHFDPNHDQLWFVGDLVNRGPHSLETLRYVKQLGPAAVTVLGNHDLHLLALDAGVKEREEYPTLLPILEAPDKEELLHWLRHRPLIHGEGDWLMVHAGLWPGWSIDKAMALAGEVETMLRSDSYIPFLSAMYGNKPDAWSDTLTGHERLRCIVNVLTRMRTLTATGTLNLSFTGPPNEMPAGHSHWMGGEAWLPTTILCGHWAAQGVQITKGMAALDSGSVWGGPLTAFRLDDGKLFATS